MAPKTETNSPLRIGDKNMSVLDKILEIEAKVTRLEGELDRKIKSRDELDDEIKDLSESIRVERRLIDVVKELLLEQQNAFDDLCEAQSTGGANEEDFKSFAKASRLTYNVAESDGEEDPPTQEALEATG